MMTPLRSGQLWQLVASRISSGCLFTTRIPNELIAALKRRIDQHAGATKRHLTP